MSQSMESSVDSPTPSPIVLVTDEPKTVYSTSLMNPIMNPTINHTVDSIINPIMNTTINSIINPIMNPIINPTINDKTFIQKTCNPMLRYIPRPSPSFITPCQPLLASPISLDTLPSSSLLDHVSLPVSTPSLDLVSTALKRNLDCLLEQTIQSLHDSFNDLSAMRETVRLEQSSLTAVLQTDSLRGAITDAVQQYYGPVIQSHLNQFKLDISNEIRLVNERSSLIAEQSNCMLRLLNDLVAKDAHVPIINPSNTIVSPNSPSIQTSTFTNIDPDVTPTSTITKRRRAIQVVHQVSPVPNLNIVNSPAETDIWNTDLHSMQTSEPIRHSKKRPKKKAYR
ncbi:hypothetical protein O5D80_005467 [Batrachochytrium dendrobatidis]|nr:hypothetical protein O5D80_005467 [Batrachochytrium dendrobatidis]